MLIVEIILSQLFFHSLCSAQPLNWEQTPYEYIADNEKLLNVLDDFAVNFGITSQISKSINETISDRISADSPDTFLSQIVQKYNLAWFYDGHIIYFSKNSENRNKIFELNDTSLDELENSLIASGIYDDKYPVKQGPTAKIISVFGPPRYIEFVQSTLFALEQENRNQSSQPAVQSIQIFPLKYSSATDRKIKYRDSAITAPGVATILSRVLRGPIRLEGYQSPNNSLQPVIEADPTLNAIIIRDTPEKMHLYQDLINKLDKPIARIEISLSIIDINTENFSSLGIDWGANIKIGNSHFDVNSTYANPSNTLNASLLDATGVSQLMAKIHLLENSEALIDHNETYYVKVSGERIAELKSITYGTLMQLTPRIVKLGQTNFVNMTLHIEDGNQKINSTGIDGIPTINRTVIDTVTRVELGKSLLIGGIYRDSVTYTESQVPLLGDIPYLGALFRHKGSESRRIVRLFIIQPRLIDTDLPAFQY